MVAIMVYEHRELEVVGRFNKDVVAVLVVRWDAGLTRGMKLGMRW